MPGRGISSTGKGLILNYGNMVSGLDLGIFDPLILAVKEAVNLM